MSHTSPHRIPVRSRTSNKVAIAGTRSPVCGRSHRARLSTLVSAFVVVASICGIASQSANAAPKLRIVPTAYPTIQSAVDAAQPGDTIAVHPGTYREQISIDKDLAIIGSGPGSTTIRAPGTLVDGEDGRTSIVEIRGGASVAISRLTVSGPGSGTCANGALGSGIQVLDAAHLVQP